MKSYSLKCSMLVWKVLNYFIGNICIHMYVKSKMSSTRSSNELKNLKTIRFQDRKFAKKLRIPFNHT